MISGRKVLATVGWAVVFAIATTAWMWFTDVVLFDDDDFHLWPILIGGVVIWTLGLLLESYVTGRRARADH